ncbi:MAG: DEAD/DEAH box helicase [Actinomycetes bacterium]
MDPRDVLDLLATTSSASGAVAAAAAEGRDDPDAGLVHVARLPERRAELVELPADVPRAVAVRLEQQGITALYRHQAEVFELARAGRDVVVATGTASGKTLAYQLPVLTSLLADDRDAALYLAPTKALARDQLRALRDLRLPQVRAAVVDGDVPAAERDAIRRTANWLLTNPDLLHHSLLPDHARWADLLHRLRWVVVDESHVARGVFGAHIALVLRRLRRMCERYGSDPTFLLTSATIGNPAEHATTLVGREVVAVERDGSPRGPLDLGLWQPALEDDGDGVRRSLLRETGDLLASFVGADVQTLAFVRSRKAAELIAQFARERLVDTPDVADTVRAYRGGYLPEERRRLEQDLRDGTIRGLAATNALELGIDVAGLDAVLLAGWPGTAASFWQRLGRAGRAGGAAVGVLVAADDPLDHYLVTHPEELLTRPPEDAILDPANPYQLGPHLRCACHELPLTDEDAVRWFGPTAPDLLAAGVADGVLRRRGERTYPVGRGRPQAEVDLRGAGGGTVRIIDAETGALVGDVDGGRAHSQVHDGAIYLHQGVTYEIAALDLERGLAAAVPEPGARHTTRARSDTDVRLLAVRGQVAWAEATVALVDVEVTTQVTGYDVLHPGSSQPAAQVPLELPPQVLETVAVLWTVPEDVLLGAGVGPGATPGALHAAEHAAIGMLPLIALCDRWDLGGLSTARHADTDLPSVFVYDGAPGGAGLAERSYLRLVEHLTATRETVATCRCRTGCPSCVQSPKCGNGNEPLDKAAAVRVLDLLLARAPADAAARAAASLG